MRYETFAEALKTALPNLVMSEEPSAPPPLEYTRVSFDLAPVPKGVRLSIQVEGGEPFRQEFTSEQEAAAFVGRLVDRSP